MGGFFPPFLPPLSVAGERILARQHPRRPCHWSHVSCLICEPVRSRARSGHNALGDGDANGAARRRSSHNGRPSRPAAKRTEHRVTARCLGRGHFFLHHVPVLTSLPFTTRKISTAIMGFGPQPT